jgi:hypothetical protein
MCILKKFVLNWVVFSQHDPTFNIPNEDLDFHGIFSLHKVMLHDTLLSNIMATYIDFTEKIPF